jgi:hypothetical protein
MRSKPSFLQFRAAKRLSLLACAAAMAAFTSGCNTESEDPAVITIISPQGGTFKLSEPFTMIVKCDYGKFASGLNYQLSTDSMKTWQTMISRVRKEGVALDTLTWDPVGDPPGDVPVGRPVNVRVIDYNKAHFTISKGLTFTN